MPKLIIKKTDTKDSTDLEKTVLQYLTQDKTIQTKSLAYKNNDTLIINCMNEVNINSLVNTLGEKLTNNFKIEKEQINKPKLKVIDIDMENSDDNEIEQDINQKNFSNIEDNCKVLHVYKNERTNRKCAIIEVTSNIYKYIKDNKSRLFVGHQSCTVYDIINTTPCNKCSKFGHGSQKCENSATCNTCTESPCIIKVLKCNKNTAANCFSRMLSQREFIMYIKYFFSNVYFNIKFHFFCTSYFPLVPVVLKCII